MESSASGRHPDDTRTAKISYMARFNYSGVAITGGTGRLNSSLGGTVLLRNGVVRNYVTPVNPQTALQTTFRLMFQYFTSVWKSFAPANKAAWEAARTSDAWQITDPFTGTSRPYSSAKAMFQSLNSNANIALGTVDAPTTEFESPPAKVLPSGVGFTSLIADVGEGTFELTYSGTLASGERIVQKLGPQQSQGYTKIRQSLLRQMTASLAASPIDFITQYEATFGSIAVGAQIFYETWVYQALSGEKRMIASGAITVVA